MASSSEDPAAASTGARNAAAVSASVCACRRMEASIAAKASRPRVDPSTSAAETARSPAARVWRGVRLASATSRLRSSAMLTRKRPASARAAAASSRNSGAPTTSSRAASSRYPVACSSAARTLRPRRSISISRMRVCPSISRSRVRLLETPPSAAARRPSRRRRSASNPTPRRSSALAANPAAAANVFMAALRRPAIAVSSAMTASRRLRPRSRRTRASSRFAAGSPPRAIGSSRLAMASNSESISPPEPPRSALV